MMTPVITNTFSHHRTSGVQKIYITTTKTTLTTLAAVLIVLVVVNVILSG